MVNEPTIRMGAFFGLFFLVAVGERRVPRRALEHSKGLRWSSNLGLSFLNSALLRGLFPLLAVDLARLAKAQGWGLLNQLPRPEWAAVLFSVVFLDGVIYLQHVLFHAVPALWRLHRVHHSDLDYDVTTALRFHPIEILLSMLIKLIVVAALGPPPLSVLVFEILLNGTAMFNHGNLALPLEIDGMLRMVLVTPDMHRIHHSVRPRETHSNFGFNLPWWDRLFGTYRAEPEQGHVKMSLGLPDFRDAARLHFFHLLAQPFLKAQQEDGIMGKGRGKGGHA